MSFICHRLNCLILNSNIWFLKNNLLILLEIFFFFSLLLYLHADYCPQLLCFLAFMLIWRTFMECQTWWMLEGTIAEMLIIITRTNLHVNNSSSTLFIKYCEWFIQRNFLIKCLIDALTGSFRNIICISRYKPCYNIK